MSDRRPWKPAASLTALRFRAAMLAQVRRFFEQREVLEVCTPALSRGAATDPQIESFRLSSGDWWLQSSPEFHMKRLLAAGSGPIYQIAPAFRCEEQGRWHNAEFSMLEWYRPGYDHHLLMGELAALWCELAGQQTEIPRYRYSELIENALELPWAQCDEIRLREALQSRIGELPQDLDMNGLLDAAMALLIGPALGQESPCFVYDFPAQQAALARTYTDPQGLTWACRFELYWRGQELANGFYELTDANEQRRRFEQDLQQRKLCGQVQPALDECLIEALQQGLPDCAGVAVGLDRLCALLMGAEKLSSVMSFPSDRA